MNTDYYEAIKKRRTIYGISEASTIPNEKITEIINGAVAAAPSAFNSQSARIYLLLGAQHKKLWDITKEALRKVVPKEIFAQTEQKIESFRSGHGTILYFEDQSIIEGLQKGYPLYSENFPVWSQQSSGMLQFIIWTALASEGLGASLQHYNPLIDEEVRKVWGVPANWKLVAEMPFGKPTAAPGEKVIKPLEQRVKVFE